MMPNTQTNDIHIIQEDATEIATVNASGVPELSSTLSPSNQTVSSYAEKTIYTAPELIALKIDEQPYLASPVFPQIGTAVIAGKPGIGKSMLARQFSIHVASGMTEFLGLPLKIAYQRAVYVSTEDHVASTSVSLGKQQAGLSTILPESLVFIFADDFTQAEIISHLDAMLLKDPADLVVIDSFGDIFNGSDSNNNIEMRRTVSRFNTIAVKHRCLVLFVHHINKGAYNQLPSQDQIQGGGGLVQKVRLAIILSEGIGSKRYFTVVKGNYTPKTYRDNAIVLEFNESTLIFEETGEVIPLSNIPAQAAGNLQNPDQKQFLVTKATAILGNGPLTYMEFVSVFMSMFQKSEATAKRLIKRLREENVISEVEGRLMLTQTQPDANILPVSDLPSPVNQLSL